MFILNCVKPLHMHAQAKHARTHTVFCELLSDVLYSIIKMFYLNPYPNPNLTQILILALN